MTTVATCTTVLALLLGLAHSGEAASLIPRIPPEKPASTPQRSGGGVQRVMIKLAEETELRGHAAAQAQTRRGSELVEALLAVQGIPRQQLRPMFPRDPAEMRRERDLGQARTGRQLADLTLYYVLDLEPEVNAAQICDRLNALPEVELAMLQPRPAPPPSQALSLSPAPPPTPDLSAYQIYVLPPPSAIGSLADVPGGDGAGVEIVDIEYSWVLDHEDLRLGPDALLDSATPLDPFPEEEGSHGTAVLGILTASSNGFGVTGIASAARVRVVPVGTDEFGFDVGRAVTIATAALEPGDVIVIEQQACVCNPCEVVDSSASYLGPVEWVPAWFDTIRQATALGIIVVEAAGNGAVDLDSPSCLERFNRALHDSGAILVGAGDATRTRLGFSSFGRRVDVQALGEGVVTTGYGDLIASIDPRQRYTSFFNGTSSATAIIAGAVASLQGTQRHRVQAPLLPEEMQHLLVATGSPGGPGGHIGPLPNLPLALATARRSRSGRARCDGSSQSPRVPGSKLEGVSAPRTTDTRVRCAPRLRRSGFR